MYVITLNLHNLMSRTWYLMDLTCISQANRTIKRLSTFTDCLHSFFCEQPVNTLWTHLPIKLFVSTIFSPHPILILNHIIKFFSTLLYFPLLHTYCPTKVSSNQQSTQCLMHSKYHVSFKNKCD